MKENITHPLGLPDACFSTSPGTRLTTIRRFFDNMAAKEIDNLGGLLRQVGKYSFPHCTYTIAAWGLIVLPGPGEQFDPYEPFCDWTPGLAETARHWDYPNYLKEHNYLANDPGREADLIQLLEREPLDRGGRMWPNLRKYLTETKLPGIETKQRYLTCWGVVNLTKEHAFSEAVRRGDTKWDLRPFEQIFEICRPSLLIAPPASGCIDRVRKVLAKNGCKPMSATKSYRGDKGNRKWEFVWWKTPWGKTRVGKAYTHPSWWGSKTPEILSREAKLISES